MMMRLAIVMLFFLMATFTGVDGQKLRPEEEGKPGLSSTEGLPAAENYRERKARIDKRKAKATAEDNYFSSRAHKAQKHRQQIMEDDKEKKPHPDYFGHRGKVHRRPSGRLKYCKVCGIRH